MRLKLIFNKKNSFKRFNLNVNMPFLCNFETII